MKFSPEPGRRAVLLDANVLSRLARIHCLDILVKALPGNRYVTPAIYREVEAGVAAGVTYLNDVLSSIAQGEIHVLELEDDDDSYAASLPPKLGAGEAEGIALCHRLGLVFITHDRKAANFCDRSGVRCLHFRVLVEYLQKRDWLTPGQAQKALA